MVGVSTHTEGLSWKNRSAPFVSQKGYKHQNLPHTHGARPALLLPSVGQGLPSSYPVWGEAHPPPPPICLVLLEKGNSKSKSQEAPRPHTGLQVRTKDKTWYQAPIQYPFSIHSTHPFLEPSPSISCSQEAVVLCWFYQNHGGKWDCFTCVSRVHRCF